MLRNVTTLRFTLRQVTDVFAFSVCILGFHPVACPTCFQTMDLIRNSLQLWVTGNGWIAAVIFDVVGLQNFVMFVLKLKGSSNS